MPRGKPQQRALDRLNVALAQISASAGLWETNTNPDAAKTLHKQISDSIDEAYAAMSDLRHAVDLIG